MSGSGAQLVGPITVNAVDLLAGPVPVYTPAAGELVIGSFIDPDYTVPDSDAGYGINLGWLVSLNPSRPFFSAYMLYDTGILTIGTISQVLGDPVRAWWGDDRTIIANADWQAETAYASTAMIVAAGHLWLADTPGDSDVSEPDWAGNIGGSVVDGTVEWGDYGTVPTLGTATFYLLVATPVAPEAEPAEDPAPTSPVPPRRGTWATRS